MSRTAAISAPGLPGAAAALPRDARLCLFVGGLPAVASSGNKTPLSRTLGRLFGLTGSEDALESMLGPLARAGFDPAHPGKIGLAASEGLALFDAGNAVGLVGAMRSPKKWNEALKAAATEGPKPLKVPGAKDAGTAVLADGLRIAYARGKPWLYALAGFEEEAQAVERLAELVGLSPAESLIRHATFTDSVRRVSRDKGLLLWIDRSAFAQLWSAGRPPMADSETWEAPSGSTGSSWLSGLARPEGLALGVAADADALHLDGQLAIQGSLLDALDRTVKGHNVTRVGPSALARRCPLFAMSVLDIGLLVRVAPSLAGSLGRLAGRLGDVLRPGFSGDRGGGALAVGLTGIRPTADAIAPEHGEPDLFEAIDGFLVLQLLGEALPARLAGRMFDTVGDAVRGGLKRLKVVDQPDTTARLAGHTFHVAVRRGALIVATAGEPMRIARELLEESEPESLPPGFLLGAGVDAQRLLGGVEGLGEEAAVLEEMQNTVARFGRARIELGRTPGGLSVSLRQETR